MTEDGLKVAQAKVEEDQKTVLEQMAKVEDLHETLTNLTAYGIQRLRHLRMWCLVMSVVMIPLMVIGMMVSLDEGDTLHVVFNAVLTVMWGWVGVTSIKRLWKT